MGTVEVRPHGGTRCTRVREEQVRPLYAATLAALGPEPGTRLLHVGCGTGTALSLAAFTGADLAGIDSAADLLSHARERLPDADLRAAETIELPYDRGCFDQVMAFDAIQYAASPAVAVAELARVTRPGGVVAIGLWHNWSGREASAFLSAVRGRVPTPPTQGPPVHDLYRLREVMVEAGLDVFASAEVTHRNDFASLEAAWDSMTASPNVSLAIDVMGVEAAHEIFVANFATMQRADGSIQQEHLYQYALGRATS
ncbi:methyltransferase domain-containing protein [Actinoallomurus purpureus]|uniref:class I SAM-dependent methyltransferase n=1 Tax=Actinoallomurus purpureus TaxID=478114 RepID=UPI0020935C2A|nr:methyltransferase domain-containing protein [Actinoallomurus purpureus]MCO6011155.1 methyltransferase domain-containing protein [Actinoallomurus purpureus]